MLFPFHRAPSPEKFFKLIEVLCLSCGGVFKAVKISGLKGCPFCKKLAMFEDIDPPPRVKEKVK